MLNRTTLAICFTLATLMYSPTASAAPLKLKKSQLYTKTGVGTCGYVKKAWRPVTKVKGGAYKTIAGSGALKTQCSSLLKGGNYSLDKLPSLAGIVKSVVTTANVGSQTISGTPPTLAEIATTGPVKIFWRDGVISSIASGSPSPEQCYEMYGGTTDGLSSGFAGCYLTQETGRVMENILRAGTSLCYMKEFPTQEVQAAGGFTVVAGSIPGDDITKLFAPPTGSAPRFVKIRTGDSDGVIKIYSASQNAASGDQYRFDIVFCEGTNPEAQEYEQTRVTLAGEFISKSRSTFNEGGRAGTGGGTVRAFLELAGKELVFNSTRPKLAAFTSIAEGETYSSSIEVTGNEIENKTISSRGATESRKAYSISRFEGASATSTRFYEGSYKEENASFGNFATAIEFRDGKYLAAPNNPYSEVTQKVNFATDPFLSSTPNLDGNAQPYPCNQEADVELALVMESDAMRSVALRCEADRLEGMDYCRDSSLSEAQQKYGEVCRR